jgi:hypothetical protein
MHHLRQKFQVANHAGPMQRLDVQQQDGPMATEKAADVMLAGRSRLQWLQEPSSSAVEYDFHE